MYTSSENSGSGDRDAFWNHPVLQQFTQDHGSCSPAQVSLAFQVYLNLTEVRGWRDVQLHYSDSEGVESAFVTGRRSMGAELEAAYPLPMESSLSHQQIQNLFPALHVGHLQFDRIMLAICAADSSVAYYNVSKDMVKPEPPESSDARKQQWLQKGAARKRHLVHSVDTYCEEQKSKQSS